MRRLAILLVLAVGASFVPASGVQAAGEQEWQTVSGNIRFLTRFQDGEGGWPGLARRVHQAAAQSNGLIGYIFPVDPETQRGRFELEITREGGEGLPDPLSPADLGIYFYEEMGDAGGQVAPVTVAEYERRAPGGETGFVAPGSRWGVIFMSRGFDVDFTYKAYTPMTVDIRATGFGPADVTVGRGGWVVFKNLDTEFHGVKADNGSFNSSPTANHPLRPGDTFAVQFLTEGDRAYHDPFSDDGTGQPLHRGVVHVGPGPGEGTPAG